MRRSPVQHIIILICLIALCGRAESAAPARELVQSRVAQEYPSLLELYDLT